MSLSFPKELVSHLATHNHAVEIQNKPFLPKRPGFPVWDVLVAWRGVMPHCAIVWSQGPLSSASPTRYPSREPVMVTFVPLSHGMKCEKGMPFLP